MSPTEPSDFDVIIVGGGPAGLSAALVLGRCRRRVLIVDAGHPRNESSAAMHGFISRDGTPPGEFLSIAREQLGQYSQVVFKPGEVLAVQVDPEGGFRVELRDRTAARSRKLLLATGLVDELPTIPGLAAFYGRSVHHCPYCDGWEHRDQPIAIHGGKGPSVELALELTLWSRDLVVCTDGPPQFSRDDQARLDRWQIRVETQVIVGLEGQDGQLSGLRLADGSFLPRRALFFSPGQFQRSPFGKHLGCRFAEDGGIECSENAATEIPGLYVAGNASRGLQLVIMAAAEGTAAAFAMNQAMLDEELAQPLQPEETKPPAENDGPS